MVRQVQQVLHAAILDVLPSERRHGQRQFRQPFFALACGDDYFFDLRVGDSQGEIACKK